MTETPEQRRRRLISLGELIALAALIVSAAGVWVSWKAADHDERPAAAQTDRHQLVPLTLHARREDEGRQLEISPIEPGQAIESLSITFAGASPIEVGSDGDLSAADVQNALNSHKDEPKDRPLSVRVRIDSKYVDQGKERKASGAYTIRYKWNGAGLFGGRSLELLSLSR